MIKDIKELTLHQISSTKEVFCPYEVCELLKRAGFNWNCYMYYVNKEHKKLTDGSVFQNSTYNDIEIACPTIDIALQWLRVEKKLAVQMIYSQVKNEWASCVDGKYYWTNNYYYAQAEGLVQGLKEILNLECLKITFV